MRPSVFLLALWFVSRHTQAEAPRPDQADYFEKKVRPVLVAHCYRCHSTEAKKLKGGLKLDSRAGMLKGGEGGWRSFRASPKKVCSSRRSAIKRSKCRPAANCRPATSRR